MTTPELALFVLKKLWWIPLPFVGMKALVHFSKVWGKIRNKL